MESSISNLSRFLSGRNVLSNVLEVKWQLEWFTRVRKTSKGHWENERNQREFLERFATNNKITSPIDWMRVSVSLISRNGGQVSSKIYIIIRDC